MSEFREKLLGIYLFLFFSYASPFSRYWRNSYSRRDKISFSEIELNQSSTTTGINQRQLRCVNGARAPYSHRLVSSFTHHRWPRSLHGLTPSSTPVAHVCSRQRVITIASQHEPMAESRSATRGSFNIDNNPRAGVTRVFSSLSRFFIISFSFSLSSRVTELFRFFFACWLLSTGGAWLRTLRAFTLLAIFDSLFSIIEIVSTFRRYSI